MAFLLNPRRGTPGIVTLSAAGFRRAKAEIAGWAGYAPTPLLDLPLTDLPPAAVVRLKDESPRFGLGSFKALGAPYAAANALAAELSRRGIASAAVSADLADGRYAEATGDFVLAAATDGNHGRALAWAAARFHAKCVIYLHETVSAGREAAIARYGAEIRRVPGTYDDSVRACAADAEAHGWGVISDTSWPGYTEVPRDIMQGYRLMADEAADQWTGPPPTHVLIQGGVGGAAAAVAVQVRARWGDAAALIVVEPENAACLLASARAGESVAVDGDLDTVMAGLACGEPSLLAWQELERAAAAFMTIPDAAAVDTMRWLAARGIVSGESGAAGLAAFRVLDDFGRVALGFGPDSRVLAFSTEGATDPELYRALVGDERGAATGDTPPAAGAADAPASGRTAPALRPGT